MTAAQRDRCRDWLAKRRDAALAAGLYSTAKSWEDSMYWLGVNWRTMILARDLDDGNCNDAGTVDACL